MTVHFVTHALKTGDITVMGNVSDVAIVRGSKISRVGAVEGQEQQNPAAVHINLEVVNSTDEMLVLMLNVSDAMELGLELLAMGVKDRSTTGVDEIRDRLAELMMELDRTLQVAR